MTSNLTVMQDKNLLFDIPDSISSMTGYVQPCFEPWTGRFSHNTQAVFSQQRNSLCNWLLDGDMGTTLVYEQLTPTSVDQAVHLPNWAPWGQNQPKKCLGCLTPWSSIGQMNSLVTWCRCNMGHPNGNSVVERFWVIYITTHLCVVENLRR